MLTETLTLKVTVAAPPATCCCREYHLNKMFLNPSECIHTRGERPADSAVPFDARRNVAEARAFVAAQRKITEGK
jgi:hypothetical protein